MARWLALLLCCGCFDTDALSAHYPVSGNYTVTVTNGDNGCGFPNWNVGDTSGMVPIALAQDGDIVTATIQGIVGTLIQLYTGTNVFSGQPHGSEIVLDLVSTKEQMKNNCTFHVNAEVRFMLSGNNIMGTHELTVLSNNSPDCGMMQSGCKSVQTLVGTRN